MPSQNTNQLTPGKIAVGIQFNPGNNLDVQKLKELFASAFDMVESAVPADDGTVQTAFSIIDNETARKRKMRDAALNHIITAQMWAVKVITLN